MSATKARRTTHKPRAAEFARLANDAPVMMWRTGTHRGGDWFNRPWLEFAGRDLELEVGFGWTERLHPEDHPHSLGTFHEAFEAQREFHREFRLLRHDGAWRWLRDHGRPFQRHGRFAGFVGCCIDITEMKQAMQERETLLLELQHRVRNNAQATASFLGLQAQRSGDPLVAAALQAAATRVLLATLVQDRMFRLHGAGQVALGPEVAAAASAAFELAERPGLRLELVLHEPAAVPVRRAAPIALMVNELVTNALRHGFPAGRHGRVRVVLTRPAPGQAELLVEDDGVGLAAAPRRFFGLHLVERLARQAQATLEFGPGPGTAATLRFTDLHGS